MILLTGTGALAEAYIKVNPEAYTVSFRSEPEDNFRAMIKNADVLIHNSAGLKDEDAIANIGITKRIVWLVLTTKPDIKFIHIGSMSYLSEAGYLPETKMTKYAYSKFISEKYCQATVPNLKLVRFSTLFYKDPKRDALSELCNKAVFEKRLILINGGMNTRDFLPIGLAVRELHRVVMTQTDPIINIASGKETTFLQAAKMIQKLTACKIDFTIGKIKNVLSKFEKTIDVDIENEIKSYIKYLKTE